MLVANDVSTDGRVRKMAHDLAAAGLDVTVLALSSTGTRETLRLGEAKVLRLPAEDLFSVRTRRRFGRMNRHEIVRQIRFEREQFFNRQREVAAQIGWLRHDLQTAAPLKRDEHLRRFINHTKTWPGRLPGAIARRLVRPLTPSTPEAAAWKRMARAEAKLRHRLTKQYRDYIRRQERLSDRLDNVPSNRLGSTSWRKVISVLHDYEAAFGPEIDALEPDVVHAQDIHLFGVAARAVSRSLLAGSDTKLIYDSHEYIQGLGTYPARVVSAWSQLEHEYIGRADRVITVSPTIAELLMRDYQLSHPPAVVMNIPVVERNSDISVRAAAGVGPDVPLLVYSGGLDPTRGVHTLVKAVGHLDGVHLALITRTNHSYVTDLQDIASDGGYHDRLHIVSFVEPQHVVTYLASATIGVHTIVAGPMNHEVTLPNKVFEYMHARLPIVISNCKVMSAFVSQLGVGEVFLSENVDSLVEKISKVLQNLDKYRLAYERQPEMLKTYSWGNERKKLFAVYQDLLGEGAIGMDLEQEVLAPLVEVR